MVYKKLDHSFAIAYSLLGGKSGWTAWHNLCKIKVNNVDFWMKSFLKAIGTLIEEDGEHNFIPFQIRIARVRSIRIVLCKMSQS